MGLRDEAVDLGLERGPLQRLFEERVGAGYETVLARTPFDVARDHENLRRPRGRVLFHLAADMETVEARHEDVEDQEVRPEGADLHETLVTVVRRFHRVSRVQTQDLGQRVEEPRIVVDDEEARRLLFVDRRRGHVEHRLEALELGVRDPEVTAGSLEGRQVPLPDPPLDCRDRHLTGGRDLPRGQEAH